MRPNIFKYIFFILVIGLLIFAIYYIKKDEKSQTKKNEQQTSNVQKERFTDLRIGITEFDTLNPIISKNKSVQEISRLIFDSLLTLDKEYKLQPSLAKEYSKVDNNNYIIKLNENIKWQDGTNFTSKDVQFTINKIQETSSIYSYNLKNVTEVEIIDEHTIKIKLDKEVPFFEYNLTFPILSYEYYYEQDFINTEKNKNPIGTGIYKITSINDNTITLSKNQNYWKYEENFILDTIKINIYSSMGEVYNAFKIENIDIINTSITNVEEYVGTIGFNKKEYKGREYDFLAFNCENNVLKNTEVRQAINYGLDKSNIISKVYDNQYYIANFPLDYNNWLNTINYDITLKNDKAKECLSQNGWKNTNNIWSKNVNSQNIQLSFNLVVLDESNRVAVAENIREQLQNIGIKININKVNKDTYINYLNNKNYDIILAGTYSSFSPDLSLYLGENNLANYNNEEAQSIIKDMKNIVDNNLLKEKFLRLIEIYNTDIPYISLSFSKNTLIYKNSVMGDICPNNYNPYYNVQYWYREY